MGYPQAVPWWEQGGYFGGPIGMEGDVLHSTSRHSRQVQKYSSRTALLGEDDLFGFHFPPPWLPNLPTHPISSSFLLALLASFLQICRPLGRLPPHHGGCRCPR
ncbi:hypothetical protein Naga_100503g3 [Nannochloropsis gaditana]|uniref:Uncharacterized protein n=1 Tax=Nannochloropsis gaditana TaxID=72520 RepID=W7TSQ8_9STRA|nr:hypothetical protein Naga_100503g3 [Nannochloropsis gaditana]